APPPLPTRRSSDLVDAQIAVDLAVQGDGGASEFAVFGLPAVGALACEGAGDRALVLQLRQEVVLPTVSAVIAAICGSAGRQGQSGSACSRRHSDCASKLLHHVGPFHWTRPGRCPTRGAATMSTGT